MEPHFAATQAPSPSAAVCLFACGTAGAAFNRRSRSSAVALIWVCPSISRTTTSGTPWTSRCVGQVIGVARSIGWILVSALSAAQNRARGVQHRLLQFSWLDDDGVRAKPKHQHLREILRGEL